MKNVIPEDPKARRRMIRKVLIIGGVTAGVITTAVVIRRLGQIETDIEVVAEIATDVVEAVEALGDTSSALL